MYKVGYVDDDDSAYGDYKKRLGRKGIDLLFVQNCNSLNDIYDWVVLNAVECLIVDHILTAKYDFHGTKVVAHINNQLPDLPCIILTNYPEDSVSDNLVMKNLILDRHVMANDDINDTCDLIKQAAEVFRNRLKIHLEKYSELYQKKSAHIISAEEEETLMHLYKLLRAYGEVDDIPTELLKSDVNQRIDSLMKKLDNYIDSNTQD
ncbi:hypothetical protein [Paenibacillus sp. DR312]|uniref:hypothetical protein n=1 Tax=unclassified Paenibacillus TaxID=185978 RepID=UPI001C96144A|nr:hypothetical protein [Paenibacillus sp. DR312]QZN78021.1 hypothetical protein K5K90_13000 [Paenibacillus sp. DR312]